MTVDICLSINHNINAIFCLSLSVKKNEIMDQISKSIKCNFKSNTIQFQSKFHEAKLESQSRKNQCFESVFGTIFNLVPGPNYLARLKSELLR